MSNIPIECLDSFGLVPTSLHTSSPCLDDPRLYQQIIEFAELSETQSPDKTSSMEMTGMLLEILNMLIANTGLSIRTHQEQIISNTIDMVRQHIMAHADEELSLKELARMTALSPWRLNKVFSTQIGMPPHEYQNMIRVNRVKRLIANGTSLAEASVTAGYSDQSHMTRLFKKTMGMTPGKYARGFLKER